MTTITSKIQQYVSRARLHNFWPNFKPVAYAIYNEQEVTLFNHPSCNGDNYITLTKTDEFNACTLILFDQYPTAIVDEQLFSTFEDMYAVLIHELFHGYQYSYGETRFPDELIGLNYSLCENNISLRIEEQKALYKALQSDQLAALYDFIAFRKTRITLFPQETSYEAAIETIEGPAYYIENKAFQDIAADKYEQYIEKSLYVLTDAFESHLHIRKSCYSTGLAMCLLLDRYATDWHQQFTQSEYSLFEFFESFFPNKQPNMSIPNYNQLSKQIIQKIGNLKQSDFDQFDQSIGYKLVITGTLTAVAFDPMNITIRNSEAIHFNFIKILTGSTSYSISQPVKTTFVDNFKQITRLELYTIEKPIIVQNQAIIASFQLPFIDLKVDNNIFYLTI